MSEIAFLLLISAKIKKNNMVTFCFQFNDEFLNLYSSFYEKNIIF